MKLKEMTPEQQEAKRKYDREAKRRQRDRQKQEKERLNIPNARDYMVPEHQQKQLDEYTRSVMTAIAADLNLEKLTDPDEYIITGVSCVLFGMERQFAQVVDNPSGMLRHCHISMKPMSRSDLPRSQMAILNGGMEDFDGGRAIFRRL